MSIQAKDEWPIYSLANYEGSGKLIELFLTILWGSSPVSPTANKPGEENEIKGTTTSDYQTQDSDTNKFKLTNSQRLMSENNLKVSSDRKVPIRSSFWWWQLSGQAQIGVESNAGQLVVDLDSTIRTQVMQLCFSLHKLVRLVAVHLLNAQHFKPPTSTLISLALISKAFQLPHQLQTQAVRID